MHEAIHATPSPIMNDEVQKDGDDFECPNIHNKPHGGNDTDDDANEDHVHCLSSIFPNTDNNPVENVYTRDSTGRVVSIEACLKVPQNEAAVVEATEAESRHVISGKCKKSRRHCHFEKEISCHY
jgi:hypothetical protein